MMQTHQRSPRNFGRIASEGRYSVVEPTNEELEWESEAPAQNSKSVWKQQCLNIFFVVALVMGVNTFLIAYAKPEFRNPESGEKMSWEPYVVLNAVALSIWLMAIGLPADLLLMAVSGSFCMIGIIRTEELLEGLSNSGVVAVAVLCVVSKAVDKTKALNGLMSACLGAPSSTMVAMLRMAFPVVTLGTVFNNTPLVAVMIPIVKSWTGRVGLQISHFMMPLSFITMLSACITTMGSSTNLLAVELVPEAKIQFLDLAPVGVLVMAVGVAYCALLAPYFLPSNSPPASKAKDETDSTRRKLFPRPNSQANTQDDGELLDPERYTVRFTLAEDGPLMSYTPTECRLLDCLPSPARVQMLRGSDNFRMAKGDEIEVSNATADDIAAIQAVPGLKLMSLWAHHRSSDHLVEYCRSFVEESPSRHPFALPVRKWVAATVEGGWKPTVRPFFEVVVSTGGLQKAGRKNSFVGDMSLASLQDPLSDYHLTLVAMRGKNPEDKDVVSLSGGEVLLVQAVASELSAEAKKAFRMVLPVAEAMPPEQLILSPIDPLRPVLAVLGLAGCVVLSALKIVPLDSMALLVGLGSILLGTLSAKEFYGAINGPVLLTVAASFGLGEAFAKTGVASMLAQAVLGVAETGGPYVLLGSVVGLALLLGVVVSNNTTVILLAPLVKDICERQGLDLKMMMLAVVYAANLSFATPFSYQTNMMVMPHGSYVFMDYVKFGVPMMLLCGLVAVVGTILYWG